MKRSGIIVALTVGVSLFASADAFAQTTSDTTSNAPTAALSPTTTPPVTSQFREGSNPFELLSLTNGQDGGRSARMYDFALTFARCSVHLGQARAVKFLQLPSGSNDEVYAVNDFVSRFRGCSVGTSMLPIRFIRGAIAEASFMRTTVAATFPDRARTVDAQRYLSYLSALPALPEDNHIARLQRVAQCQTVLAPGLVRRVFETKIGSAAEAQSLDRVYAAVPVCGGGKRPDTIVASMQRATLAEAFYFWTKTGKPLPDA
jgi:hypothetical protein